MKNNYNSYKFGKFDHCKTVDQTSTVVQHNHPGTFLFVSRGCNSLYMYVSHALQVDEKATS